ncbi:unnamed protein product [Hymenolepis diminuta]|uniref:Retrovirus-related Pol polyprotein from transposon TNT 1-94 n=1 Tax=Hymenolepis diminuta TaxID=6216 RepID=A0A0R3SR07_HYMDI|nr:unnamed protein product [Hymenolepis diminuta]
MFFDYSDNIAAHFGLSCGVVTSTPLVEYTPQTPCFVRFKSPVKNVELKPAKSNFYEPILGPVNQYEDPYFNFLRTSGFKEEKLVYSSLKNNKLQGNFKRSLLVYRSVGMDPSEKVETIKAPTTTNEGHEFTVKPMPSSGEVKKRPEHMISDQEEDRDLEMGGESACVPSRHLETGHFDSDPGMKLSDYEMNIIEIVIVIILNRDMGQIRLDVEMIAIGMTVNMAINKKLDVINRQLPGGLWSLAELSPY